MAPSIVAVFDNSFAHSEIETKRSAAPPARSCFSRNGICEMALQTRARAYAPSKVHSPRTGGARGKDFFERGILRSQSKRRRSAGERARLKPCGHSLHRAPCPFSVASSLSPASYRIKSDSRGRNEKNIVDRCPYASNDRLKLHYARSWSLNGAITGYAPHRRRHLRELEKGSTDYSTWHVGPEATGEERDRLQRRGTDVGCSNLRDAGPRLSRSYTLYTLLE